LTEEQALGKHISDPWPEELRDQITNAANIALSGVEHVIEVAVRNSEGDRRWWSVTFVPLKDETGLVTRFMIVADDVSDRRVTEEALRASEHKYSRLFQRNPLMISLSTLRDGCYLEVNEAFTKVIGYTPEEAVGRTAIELGIWKSLEDRTRIVNMLQRNGSLTNVEVSFRSKSGEEIQTLASAEIIDIDGEECLLTILSDITDRKKAEQALRESEQKIRWLTENMLDVVCQIDKDRKVLYISASCESVLGYKPEELIGQTISDYLHPDDAPRVFRTMADAVVNRRSTATMKYRFRHSAGHYVWRESTCRLSYDDQGNYVGAIYCTRDITERVQAMEAMRRSEEFLNAVFNGIQDGITVLDPELNIVRVNAALEREYGLSGPVVGRKCYEAYHGNCEPCKACPTLRTVKTARAETEVITATNVDGKIIWLELSAYPMLDACGNVVAIIEHSRDITSRLKCEAQQRTQVSAMNAAGDQIVISDASGQIEFVNPAFEQETGYTFCEVVGKELRPLGLPDQDPELCAEIDRVTSLGQTWQGEITSRRKDGTQFIEDVTVTPVKGECGAIEHFIAIKRNITEKKQTQAKLDYLAHHDSLTGLPNRLLFSDRLTQRLAQARRDNTMFAVMFLDLDRFKLINDTLGHGVGDQLLKAAALRLTECLREVDTIARMGGDEFTLIVPNIHSADDATKVAQRVQDALSDSFCINGRELFITTSIGISVFPHDGTDAETLVKNADTAMYRAKEQGTSTYEFYTEELNTIAIERMTMENDLRRAVERSEFVLHYQPQVDISTGRTVGVEALIRWLHPEIGMVSPAKFIPLSEETGLIVPISEWVLRTACAQNKAWQDAGLPPIQVAVNISARLLQESTLAKQVEAVLRETDLAPEYLGIEITEGTLMRNPELAISVLHELKSMGVHISIDDFGTGYSSLSYLKRFPIDVVKLDQSFVRDITTNSDDAAIASAIVALAHSLKLKVIPEGVETLEQLDYLRSLKCDKIQGYFVSPPVAADSIAHLLRETHTPTQEIYREVA